MSDMIRTLLSRAPRYQVMKPAELSITLEGGIGRRSQLWLKDLDLSSNGAELRVANRSDLASRST